MNIKRYAVFLVFVLAAFLTLPGATAVFASDDAKKGVSPSDASIKVVMPEKSGRRRR